MTGYIYLASILFSLTGLGLADYRYKLAFFYNPLAALLTVTLSMLVFLVWDYIGVSFDIFFVGGSQYLSGIRVLPEIPIEELFFLALLAYCSLLVWRGLGGK